jgi:hypothetical protein
MTSLVEEARWSNLRDSLEDQFDQWDMPDPGQWADRIVYNLRRSGWRVPLPADSKVPPRGRAASPKAVRKHLADCRSAIRNAREDA